MAFYSSISPSPLFPLAAPQTGQSDGPKLVATLEPVDYDPFSAEPVEHDPFLSGDPEATAAEGPR
jgi:hypothetical protein